ncbi:MAG: translation initiation factor IF-2, partial [Ferruginibacter sp.]
MSEANTPRLMAAAKEFNIGKDTLIDFLVSRSFPSDDLKPTSKLTEEMYRVLQTEFQGDKVAKQKAEQIDLPKAASSAEPKKKRDEEDLSFKKKEEKPKEVAKPAEEPKEEIATPVVAQVEVPIEEKTVAPDPAPQEATIETLITNIEAPELEAPKVINKIDLDAIDSSTRPKKSIKKKTEETEVETPKVAAKKTAKPVEEKAPKIAPEPKPVEIPEEITPDQSAKIENIQAEKLTGPKIMGKIELPKDNDTRPKRDLDDKHKRKRIPLPKKPGAPGQPSQPGQQGQQNGQPRGNRAIPDTRGGGGPFRGNTGTAAPNRFARPGQTGAGIAARKEDKIIDAKEIQEKLKQTQAKLAGSGGRGKSLKAKYRKAKREEMADHTGEALEGNKLQVTEFISVSELANLMEVSFAEVIGKCMSLGIMVSINQRLEADVIELVAGEFNFEVEFIGVEDAAELEEDNNVDSPEDLKPRAPIVTIMGHVDHGKTSLLDYIRNTNVIAGEAGGITQHIGAYEVTTKDGRAITFLDTPGHEAFTAMRARGAKVTDIAVIVVAADDAVMPQTKEAISHAQAANVPMIFAINKIDRDGANPEKIKEQLAGMNILVESWGGKFQSQEISAKQGLNIDLLLEKILLETDILELTANPDKQASGTIIEASLDKGRGYVATILVQNGTLKQGDMIVSGQHFGKIKAMYNERNQRIEKAPPSTPMLILGLNGAPQAGEVFR